MSRPTRPAPNLLPPPREVPANVKVRVLAHRDVLWGAPFFVMAAALLYVVSPLQSENLRVGLVIAAGVFFLVGLHIATARFFRGLRAISVMGCGVVAPARIASGRLLVGRHGKHVAYGDLLSNWESHLNEAMIGPKSWSERWFADRYGKRVAAIRENLQRLARDLDGLSYGEIARRIEDLAVSPAPIPYKRALPEEAVGIEVDCRAEFAAGGEARAANGRIWLSDRLDPAGLEPLVYDPARPSRVVFLRGLPVGVSIDPQGRWIADPAMPQAIALALTLGAAASSLLQLLWYMPWLVARFR